MEFFTMLSSLDGGLLILFLFCMATVFIYEFINGFHDTANAVATVIYTKSLTAKQAVFLSGFLNFAGMALSVYLFGMKVAVKMVQLLPMEKIADMSIHENIALVAAVLVSAIIWNFGTWYFGIPCSSSHTMIGSLLGAMVGFFLISGGSIKDIIDSKPFEKGIEVLEWMLISPLFGFTIAIVLVYIFTRTLKKKALFKEANTNMPPPTGIRALLIGTCSLVSFFHGSNDGQKGLGLIMIILMTFFPLKYALKSNFSSNESLKHLSIIEQTITPKNIDENHYGKTIKLVKDLKNDILLRNDTTKKGIFLMRKRMTSIQKDLEYTMKEEEVLSKDEKKVLREEVKYLKSYTDGNPGNALLMMIALAIGLGTVIGWKRIVVTIGEKIGKTHMTYGQGATAEIVAASTIGLSTYFGLPVSTTHVLTSGVAGSMVATGGTKNLQKNTMTSIVLAWILTLPVTIILSLGLYLLFRIFI
jgi:PiT family inorganic phosphate transporter